MVDDGQVTGYQLGLEDSSIRNLNSVTLVCDDDDRSCELDLLADPDVTVDGQVIELSDVGDRLESFLKVSDLLEGVSELDDGCSLELSSGVLWERGCVHMV